MAWLRRTGGTVTGFSLVQLVPSQVQVSLVSSGAVVVLPWPPNSRQWPCIGS